MKIKENDYISGIIISFMWFPCSLVFFIYLSSCLVAVEPKLVAALLYNSEDLDELRRRVAWHDPTFECAIHRLLTAASLHLDKPPFSVMQKTSPASSGNRRDYMSLARYWWVNPQKEDGLPYIRRDGVVNPEIWIDKYDYAKKSKMTEICSQLSLAYYLTGNEKYAQEAAKHFKAWFIHPATAMNPHLNYAQGIPGKVSGRAEGIIETSPFPALFDSISLLAKSLHWQHEDRVCLKNWVKQYLIWLLTSPHGIKESLAPNNHGSWYDFQVVYFALFTDQPLLAKDFLGQRVFLKLHSQIGDSGEQPLELIRTKSFFYCVYNLEALFKCALLGEKVGLDLWERDRQHHASLRRALDWLLPYALGQKAWINADIEPLNPKVLAPLLLIAAKVYKEALYMQAYDQIMRDEVQTEECRLLFPYAFF